MQSKDVVLQRTAFDSVHRLVWTYVQRIKGEGTTTTRARLKSILDVFFKSSRGTHPRDVPPRVFVDIVAIIAKFSVEYACQDVVIAELLATKSPTHLPPVPERTNIGLQAFMAIANGKQLGDSGPAYPCGSVSDDVDARLKHRSSVYMADGGQTTTAAVNTPSTAFRRISRPLSMSVAHDTPGARGRADDETGGDAMAACASRSTSTMPSAISCPLTEALATDLGLGPFFGAVVTQLGYMLLSLDAACGNNMLMVNPALSHKSHQEIFTSERQTLMELFCTAVECIPRLMPPPSVLSSDGLISILARLTVHLDTGLRAQAYSALKRLLIHMPKLREQVYQHCAFLPVSLCAPLCPDRDALRVGADGATLTGNCMRR